MPLLTPTVTVLVLPPLIVLFELVILLLLPPAMLDATTPVPLALMEFPDPPVIETLLIDPSVT
jgi:hypothetical protein